jgi:hypothetical protein
MGEKMSGGGNEPAPDAFWARVRERYEAGVEAVSAIASDAGTTAQALTVKARLEGWRLRGSPRRKAPGTRETLSRFKALLQQRLSEFEAQIGTLSLEASAATSERDIRAMNTLVRTLEKVLELERKERARRTQRRKSAGAFTDAERDALAEKLAGLHRELLAERSSEAAGGDDAPRDARHEPRLANVGTDCETASR